MRLSFPTLSTKGAEDILIVIACAIQKSKYRRQSYVLYVFMYVYLCIYVYICIYSHHMYRSRLVNRHDGCQSCSWSAEQGRLCVPCPRSRLRNWSREKGSAVPSRVSQLIIILLYYSLNLVSRWQEPKIVNPSSLGWSNGGDSFEFYIIIALSRARSRCLSSRASGSRQENLMRTPRARDRCINPCRTIILYTTV